MSIGVHSASINEQFNKLFSSILIEQQKIDHIKAADEDKKELLSSKLKEYEALKGRGFFFPFMASGRGHGPFVELIDGSIKYDLINGIGVNLLGHSHPIYIKANLEAATSDTMMCGNLLSYQEPYEVSKMLLESVSKSHLKHFWFSCSGSFAGDTALKILWQKKAPNYRLIAFQKSFAGRSIAMQDVTYNQAYREGMPKTIPVDHVPHYNYNNPEKAIEETIAALDNLIAQNGNVYCALTIEVIQGEAGFIYGTKEYYKAICEWAKKNNIYVWIDEVQSFARTTELFAYQMFELDQYVDVVTIGKVLQGAGTFYTEELNPKAGLIAGTFNGSIASLNAAKATIRYLKEGNFYGEKGRIKDLEQKFKAKFKELSEGSCKGKIPYFGGIGTMLSFQVGDSSVETTNKFMKKLFDNGIITFSAGKEPTRVRFLISLPILDEHIEEIFKILEKTIHETII
ncbi:MAG: aminotransferase class III-fold pyridoxal phosphate-dependent enzyme [Bacteriovoracaceae bacterium]|nr:aminotransferase class III-fold pyridoxal phosphate-dependent enzyme [Bacteriovoracaceae bacterium]